MALQAASLVSPALSVPKEVRLFFYPQTLEMCFLNLGCVHFGLTCMWVFFFLQGKSCVCLKDSSFFGISFSDHLKSEFTSSTLRCKVVGASNFVFFPSSNAVRICWFMIVLEFL